MYNDKCSSVDETGWLLGGIMKTLVLAEKPSVGKELARVLGCKQNKNGCLESDTYIVTWALGHLVTLCDPQDYDKRLETWQMEDLPMLPSQLRLKVMKETSRQYRVVKEAMNRKDIKELVIATDAGREGELVARWIVKLAGFHKPMKRLWISSQTDKAIKEGFAKLQDAKVYDALYHSAVCRAEADWLVGLNVTRALTCKYQAQLSAGRVQTPTLAMIVAREEEIKKFRSIPYQQIQVNCQQFHLQYVQEQQTQLFDLDKAKRIVADLNNATVTIREVKTIRKKELPPQLFDLTQLQREANQRFGFSAKQTLNIMQSLYETHKLLTYPRTDSRYLSEDIVPTLKERLQAINIGSYAPFVQAILKQGIRGNKRFVDNQKVSDHHAIIPTEEYVELDRLSSNERSIYDMVVKRFLAVLMTPSEYDVTSIQAVAAKHQLKAKGTIMIEAGWRAVYQKQEYVEEEEQEEEQSLPIIKPDQSYPIKEVKVSEHMTKPSLRYTEASLLAAMEHPSKFIQDKKMKLILEDANGIGTVATRADIIEKLFNSSYIEKRGNYIYPLSKGIQLISLVPEDLRSPLLTAKWEEKLTLIAKGKMKDNGFKEEMRSYATALVDAVKQSEANYRHDNMTQKKCPVCGKNMLEVNGKRGKSLVCSDPTCKHRQQVSYHSNARCPNCHKKLTVFGEKEKRIYSCGCGFREKFDRFNETLKQKSNKVGKQDLRNYMKQQEQEIKQEKSAFQLAWEAAQKNQ